MILENFGSIVAVPCKQPHCEKCCLTEYKNARCDYCDIMNSKHCDTCSINRLCVDCKCGKPCYYKRDLTYATVLLSVAKGTDVKEDILYPINYALGKGEQEQSFFDWHVERMPFFASNEDCYKVYIAYDASNYLLAFLYMLNEKCISVEYILAVPQYFKDKVSKDILCI